MESEFVTHGTRAVAGRRCDVDRRCWTSYGVQCMGMGGNRKSTQENKSLKKSSKLLGLNYSVL
jgi:hypothetical protein